LTKTVTFKFVYNEHGDLLNVTNKKQSVVEVDRQFDGDYLKVNSWKKCSLKSNIEGQLSAIYQETGTVTKMNYDVSNRLLLQITQNERFVTDFNYNPVDGSYLFATSHLATKEPGKKPMPAK
jgi:hypothetical protein